MSEEATWYDTGPGTAERMGQSLIRTLHQTADLKEATPTENLPDVLTILPPLAEPLFRRASVLFDQPLGE